VWAEKKVVKKKINVRINKAGIEKNFFSPFGGEDPEIIPGPRPLSDGGVKNTWAFDT